jgi:hypothetical protein
VRAIPGSSTIRSAQTQPFFSSGVNQLVIPGYEPRGGVALLVPDEKYWKR